MTATVILFIVDFLWLGFSFFLSHQTGGNTSRTSLELAQKIYNFLYKRGAFDEGALLSRLNLEFIDNFLRKSAHVVIFLVLTLLICLSLRVLALNTGFKIPVWAGFAFCVLWCAADELTKIPVEGRHFDWVDVGLNAAGCALAGAVLGIVYLCRKKKRAAVNS